MDTNETIWEKIPYYAFLLLILILPIFILPYTIFPAELNKAFLFYFVTIIAAIFWFISILQKASFRIPKILLALGGIVAVWLVSSLLSSNVNLSLIGYGQETGTFLSFVFLAFSLFLASIFFQSEKKAIFFYIALFASSLLVFIFQFFQSVLNISLSPWNIFSGKIANTIGSWNEVGIFFGLTALLSLVFLELTHPQKLMKSLFSIALVVSLVGAAFVNFTTIWIVLGIFLFVFLVYLFSVYFSSQSPVEIAAEGYRLRKFIRLTVIVLLITIFFIMAKALIGDIVFSSGINSIEVRPSWTATWQVVKSVLKQNTLSALFGSGPNTFLYDWLKFKPIEINSTLFWSYPFTAGIGILPSYLATGGLLAGLSWLVFFVFMLYYGLKIISDSENETVKGLLMASFFGSLYLWVFAIIYSPGFLLTALTFLITGVFIALLCLSGKMKIIEATFLNKPKLGFISSLIIMLLMIGGIASFYLLFQKYWAAYSYGAALNLSNKRGNIDEIENLANRAVRFDPQDIYYRTLSDIGLLRLQQLVNRTDLSADDLRNQFQNLLAFAISNAQSATAANPLDYLNWMFLGQVYEAVVPFKILGAGEAAVGAYKEASARAPFDPRPLFAAGRTEVRAGNMESAKSLLESAINVKSDFASAVFLLSQIEVQLGNLKEAIKRTEQTLYLAPNDVGVLFQLGLLYYQDKNFENSRLVFERTIVLNTNYSNARYFLGLIYDKNGKTQEAIDQFKKIQELNPDNQEIQKILSNLKKGKPALEGISPPQPSPEKREAAPVDETKIENQLKSPN